MVVMATCENVLDCGIYILRCSKIGNLPSNGAVKTKSTWIFLVSSRMFWNKNYNIEKKKNQEVLDLERSALAAGAWNAMWDHRPNGQFQTFRLSYKQRKRVPVCQEAEHQTDLLNHTSKAKCLEGEELLPGQVKQESELYLCMQFSDRSQC